MSIYLFFVAKGKFVLLIWWEHHFTKVYNLIRARTNPDRGSGCGSAIGRKGVDLCRLPQRYHLRSIVIGSLRCYGPSGHRE